MTEYLVIKDYDKNRLQDAMNDAAESGYEFVTMVATPAGNATWCIVIMERPTLALPVQE